MSPVIEPTRLSSVLFTWLRLHGEADVQAVPDPLGEAYSVVWTAARASAVPSTPAQATDDTSPKTDSQTERFFPAARVLLRCALPIWPALVPRSRTPTVECRRDPMIIRRIVFHQAMDGRDVSD